MSNIRSRSIHLTKAALALLSFLVLQQLTPFALAQSERSEVRKLTDQAYELGMQKRYPEGIAVLKKAMQLDPKDEWIPNTLGLFYVNMEHYGEAVPYLEQAIKLAPNDPSAIENITRCYSKLGVNLQRTIDLGVPYLSAHGTNPESVDVWRNVAHAFAGLHRYKESYNAYDHSFDLQSDNAYYWYAACKDFENPATAQYLYPLFTEYEKRFPKDNGVIYLAPKVRLMTQMARSSDSAVKKDPFDELIIYSDPSNPKRVTVSKTFYGMVKEGLRSLPANLWQPLIGYGCKIMLTPYTADVKGEGVEKCPRGYAPGSTYYNVGGVYLLDKKYITVAEFYLDHKGKPQRSEDVADTVCHELGHAFDHFLGERMAEEKSQYYGHFSHTKAFTEAYQKDAATLSPHAKKELAYYLQTEDKAGQEELFAELFPIIFDKSAVTGSDDDLLIRSFPTTISLIATTLHVRWNPSQARVRQGTKSAPTVKQPTKVTGTANLAAKRSIKAAGEAGK